MFFSTKWLSYFSLKAIWRGILFLRNVPFLKVDFLFFLNRSLVQYTPNRLSSTIGGNSERNEPITDDVTVSNITRRTKCSHFS